MTASRSTRFLTITILFSICCFGSVTRLVYAANGDLIYGYECQKGKCIKVELNEENFDKAISLPVCRLFCGDDIGTLWPKPTGEVHLEQFMAHLDYNRIEFQMPRQNARMGEMWDTIKDRFMHSIHVKLFNPKITKSGGHELKIDVQLPSAILRDEPILKMDTDESYKLKVQMEANGTAIVAVIIANTYFGARHGMETLSQLIVYDDIRREVQMTAKVSIEDAPVYKWRGILMDTARNYFSPASIKRMLDAMSLVKMNSLHWHITDTQSFPMEVKSRPQFAKLGAYAPHQVYTHEIITDIVQHGRVRGIRVIPEFDAPAHVGEGWQHTNMTGCFKDMPWESICVEPPCGQLNPTVDGLYPVLEDIYREMFELFEPEVFHMGGDEVSVTCWNTSQSIQNWMKAKGWGLEEHDFMRLWGYFQDNALARVDRIAQNPNTPIILWTSTLTELPYLNEFLDKDRYIIQVWTTGHDPKLTDVLKGGFRTIISNYDALYLDCGFGSWVGTGNNWCSPYIGWQKVYDNSMEDIAGEYVSQVLGGEAVLWAEEIDEFVVDSRAWPRASALAERLWSNPKTGYRAAEQRMLLHREYLVQQGIGADSLQPKWCMQNEDQCPLSCDSGTSTASINRILRLNFLMSCVFLI